MRFVTRRKALAMAAGAAASAVAACNGQSAPEPPAAEEITQAVESATTSTPQATASAESAATQTVTRAATTEPAKTQPPVTEASTPEPARTPTQKAGADPTPRPTTKAAAQVTATPPAVKLVPLSGAERRLAEQWNREGWTTAFSRKTIDLHEVLSGGVTRNGIPPIRDPRFVSLERGDRVYNDLEPVIAFDLNGEARAYPLQVLTWHEIVNDEVGGEPVLITFCPLCNTALSFVREVDGRIFTFGTTGKLRASNLIMWDEETESWWQQVTGEAIAGEMAGFELTFLPSAIVSWRDFKSTFPTGAVLSQNTGFNRPYGRNPYSGYDSIEDTPFLFDRKLDERLKPVERVVTVSVGGSHAAYPYLELEKQSVVYDTVGGKEIVVLWAPGTVSAMDSSIIVESRDVGGTGVFVPLADGKRVTLKWTDGRFVDQETGSEWNVLGFAMAGPLEGKRLEPVLHGDHFWFSWAAFRPDTRIFRAG